MAAAAKPSTDSAVSGTRDVEAASTKDVQVVLAVRTSLVRRILAEAKTADWFAVWAGLLCFLLLLPLVFATERSGASDERLKYLVPQPMPWQANPLDAWDWYNAAFVWVLPVTL